MELRHLRYFLALASHRSFTRAAQALHIVQPALSQQIKNLEDELKLPLFHRERQGVTLTHAGELLLPAAQRILGEVSDVQAQLGVLVDGDEGRSVHFGLMHTLGQGPIDIAELLGAFNFESPSVSVRVREGTAEELLSMLNNGELDAAVVDLALAAAPANCHSALITEEPLVVIVSPGSPLAARHAVDLAELAAEQFIQLAVGSAMRLNSLIKACSTAGFLPNFVLFPPNVAMARALVAGGDGIYVTYPWVAQSPGPTVHTLQLNGPALVAKVALVWSVRCGHSQRRFLQFAWPALQFRGLDTRGKSPFS